MDHFKFPFSTSESNITKPLVNRIYTEPLLLLLLDQNLNDTPLVWGAILVIVWRELAILVVVSLGFRWAHILQHFHHPPHRGAIDWEGARAEEPDA